MSCPFLPVRLPSRGRTYIHSDPNGIMARPYTGDDEIVLSQINPANMERNFLVVMKRILQGVDPLDLTIGDRLWLIIWQYINSYSEIVKVDQMCSSCMEVVTFSISLKTDLEIKELDPEISIPTTVTLPVSQKVVHLRPLTVRDEVAIEQLLDSHVPLNLYRLARSIAGQDDPLSIAEDMRTWASKDTARIRYYHEVEVDHGPILLAKKACPKCGMEEEVEVPFRLSFFYPTGSELRQCFGA